MQFCKTPQADRAYLLTVHGGLHCSGSERQCHVCSVASITNYKFKVENSPWQWFSAKRDMSPKGTLGLSGDTWISQLIVGGQSAGTGGAEVRDTAMHRPVPGQPPQQFSGPRGSECYIDGGNTISFLHHQLLWNARLFSVATAFVL